MKSRVVIFGVKMRIFEKTFIQEPGGLIRDHKFVM